MDTWRIWELTLPALERRHEVLAPTLPGHAGGQPIHTPITNATMADAAERAMDPSRRSSSARRGRSRRTPTRSSPPQRAGDAQRIDCPARIVWGTADRLLPWPRAAARYRTEWLPHADWVELDGIGHCPPLDVPHEAAALILG